MPRRMAIATMGLLPCLSLAGQSDAGDIARRIIRADGLPCAFLGPAPLPLTRGAGAPRARRDKSRLPRSMREAVSSGSATGHGDGPEPLWPRLASGDLRPAPAAMPPPLSAPPTPALVHPRLGGVGPAEGFFGTLRAALVPRVRRPVGWLWELVSTRAIGGAGRARGGLGVELSFRAAPVRFLPQANRLVRRPR